MLIVIVFMLWFIKFNCRFSVGYFCLRVKRFLKKELSELFILFLNNFKFFFCRWLFVFFVGLNMFLVLCFIIFYVFLVMVLFYVLFRMYLKGVVVMNMLFFNLCWNELWLYLEWFICIIELFLRKIFFIVNLFGWVVLLWLYCKFVNWLLDFI